MAILDASWNGFAAKQVPGFALVAGGVALLAAAIVALRSKPRVSGGRRVVRWASTFGATILVGYFAVLPIGAALWITGKPRVAVRSFAVPHENVTLRSSDGVRLAAWYVPSRNGAAIVLVHGGGGDRDGLKLHATLLARHGYGVLLYDERGRGASGGRSNAFGWDWPADVEASVDFLERRGIRHVGVLGLSTGAEVAITAAADDPRVAAVVADGAEARTLDDFAHLSGADGAVSLPYWAVTTTAVRVIRHTKPPPPLDELVPRIAPRPLLLVQRNDSAGDVDRTGVGADRRTHGRPVARRRRAHEGPRRSPARVRAPRRRALRPRTARLVDAAGDPRERANAHKGQPLQTRKGALMARNTQWTGWIGFAGCLMVIIGGIDFFQGLIAIIRGEYYAVTPNQIIVFDTTTWGWITLLWGIIVGLAGFGLLSRASWARWFAIVVGSLTFFEQLGFVGSSQYPLWALTVLFLTVMVLWALIVHWDDAGEYAV